MKKILVICAASFIGFHLVNKLIRKGFEVIGMDDINGYSNLKLDRLRTAGISNTELHYNAQINNTLYKYYRFIKLALKEATLLLKLFASEQFDFVIHLAAQAEVHCSFINPYAYVDSNIWLFEYTGRMPSISG